MVKAGERDGMEKHAHRIFTHSMIVEDIFAIDF